MALNIGDTAPSFSLYDTDKNQVQLADFQGKDLVVLFFPLAFTSVCTTELCSMRDNIGDYNALNAEVVAISIDTPFTLGKFKAEQNLNFPLLSDFNKEVSKAYGAQYDEFVLGLKGVAKRSAFVVDAEGKIKYAEVLDDATKLPNFDAVKAALS
ncbi:redoxin domain-containing protein [Fulvivirgaceae bacterium BMA12]|uniref:Redoxin domain-containing protein n=1 Tax=Agaribacillus aureus TaxID=3051825 RepID=A0ABT8LFC6_9BACT|nr:redoxin domain-containing protein [Fulvivirgaceae bacterium BMA12]